MVNKICEVRKMEEMIRNPPTDENSNIEEEEKPKRLYTHCVVSYASLDEIKPLLAQAKHYAYVLHDKVKEDESNGVHYHIIATFEQQKSFQWVRKQVVSEQNTFTEPIKGDIDDVLTYFAHEGQSGHGYHYGRESIVYDDRRYWHLRAGTGDKEENTNDVFMDDLLSKDFTVEKMCRKYGRDFAKNFRSYLMCRDYVMQERIDKTFAAIRENVGDENYERKKINVNSESIYKQ